MMDPYPASAIAEVDVDVLFIEKRNVHQFCAKYPFLALKTLKLMAKRVRKHAQLVEVLSFHDVAQRLAFFLLEECPSPHTPPHSRTRLHLQLLNHEIAVRIGSVRDVVSRAFAKLKHDGLIAVKDREIVIPDLHALDGMPQMRIPEQHHEQILSIRDIDGRQAMRLGKTMNAHKSERYATLKIGRLMNPTRCREKRK